MDEMKTAMSEAEKFLKYDYTETKDLLKTFITLISGTLVLSLTFSDKVIDFGKASFDVRAILFTSWALFIAALIASGIGLSLIAAAAGKILYGHIPFFNFGYWQLATASWVFVLISGFSYVGGLVALAVSAARAIVSTTPS